jgi:hypothetical protein
VKVAGASGSTTTDSAGRFFIPLKVPGTYLVRATARGFSSQTASVTLPPDDGAEVVLLLDANTGEHRAINVAFKEFDERLMRRRDASFLVTRADLMKYESGGLVGALKLSSEFARKALQLKDSVCVFVDGRARPTMSLDAFDPWEIEAIEGYTIKSDVSGTLAAKWPKGWPCPPSGMPPMAGARADAAIQWVVIWLKH